MLSKNMLRVAVVGGVYSLYKAYTKRGRAAFESDMKLVFPTLSKSNWEVEINNYYQLESLVNSAYENNVPMKIKKIQETPIEEI